MASAGEEESDLALSDVEADDESAIVATPSDGDVSVERFRELLAELDREKQARLSAENTKNDLQVSFHRLKALAHEAIKKRDESNRSKEDALREVERLTKELAEVRRSREEISKQRDELASQFDEVVKAKDSSRSEIESAAQMLVSGIEKISGKANHIKNFAAGGLPRSQKYTGLPAIAYGVIKRTNEIVEELLKQIDSTTNSRNEVREQMEQRNYEIAIEVSELEASIDQLKEEVSKKTVIIEDLEKSISEKDGKLSNIESELSEKLQLAENESLELKKLVESYHDSLESLENKVESQKPMLVEQLNLVSRVHDQLYNVIRIVDMNDSEHSEFSEALFLPQETGLEENIRASLAGMESILELVKIVAGKAKDVVEEKNCEVKSLNETVAQLVREKEHVGVLLRSALSKRITSEQASKANKLFQVAENGLRDSKVDFKIANPFQDRSLPSSPVKEEGLQETEEDEIYALAVALENIIKASQVEISELQHSLDDLREESRTLKERVEAQAKEISEKKLLIEELEQKERAANESVEGLMMDIAAAEEEIRRWKMAAEQEAAAGTDIEQDYTSQMSGLKEEIEEAKEWIKEMERKLKYKEETAVAAMAAKDAAEKSLRLADSRASRLRDRVEELTHQLEEVDNTRQISGGGGIRPRYVCWPWEWLGLDFAGVRRVEQQPLQRLSASNEMELSEPLI